MTDAAGDAPRDVILVHGLWMRGFEFTLMSRRLGSCGFRPWRFTYPSLDASMDRYRRLLDGFLRDRGIDSCGFVCHSLGGLVVHDWLTVRRDRPRSRVVALGTPFQGAAVARHLAGFRGGRWLIGRHADSVLCRGVRDWPTQHPLGVIAGDVAFGVGRLFHRFEEPGDGTVAVSETRVAGMTDHVTVPVTHTGLVVSGRVADLTGRFLSTGSFSG